MELKYVISLYLDSRRSKGNGLYPVKLRVFNSDLKRAKLYPTIFDVSEKEFKSAWETTKPRTEFKELRLKLQAIEGKANDTAKGLKPFTFEQFEKKLYKKRSENDNVNYQYEQIIKKFKASEQIGTASNYDLSLKSIKNFIKESLGKQNERISFTEITPDWLNKYEAYMVKTKKLSRTTVSMYLRALRAIFNIVINDKEIDPEIYPFGKNKYQIPSVSNTKKAFEKKELKKLRWAKALTDEQEKARDFWFLSYSCSGMNIKDIAMLRWKDIDKDYVTFYRAKTINTSKEKLKKISVYLTEFAKGVIKKYGAIDKRPNDLIFSIISDKQSAIEKHDSIKNFTRFINQNIKKLAISEGLTGDISTYWARHSYATNAVRGGASLAFIGESLGHSNPKTTMNYFAGFENKDKKIIANNLMDL